MFKVKTLTLRVAFARHCQLDDVRSIKFEYFVFVLRLI